ncbi:hypothetical protein FNV43_RR11606 [Rhamnella rubrinervis]|uniref:Receptor-like protein 12 n=1 Tax=Rhamnella rubrinervis TaxID=2594499 RepID=A0A8K0H606_9ROSA|nr:hypothetical protein FNV43_RR11606 [Rhamnella rubrinervis]
MIPHSFCHVSTLEIVDLSNNSLSGSVPQCFHNFSSVLSVLDLRMNNLQGTIPDTFVGGNSLMNLVLNGNHLEGSLPRSLVKFESLETLDLGNNHINATFPHCAQDETPQPPPKLQENDDPDSKIGFDWKFALMGYGCGAVFGLSMGYIVLQIGKPLWLVSMVEVYGKRRVKRPSYNNSILFMEEQQEQV